MSKPRRSYYDPDPKHVHDEVDVPKGDLRLQIPAEMSEQRDIYNRYNFTLTCTANISPKYSFVDLHLGNNCIKLWALYPGGADLETCYRGDLQEGEVQTPRA